MIEATMSLPRLLVLAVIGLAPTVALAELLPACSAQPFDDESAAQYEQRLVRTCGGEHAQWKLETARARPLDPGPSLLNAQFSTVATRTLDAWRGTLQMDWAGTRSETAGSRTARAMLGASSLLRLQDWALHVKFGHQMVGDLSTRATVTSVWQPSRSALVFAEWAGVQIGSLPSDRAQRVGARWWPVPGLMALDVVARHLPNGPGWVDQRLALTLQFKH